MILIRQRTGFELEWDVMKLIEIVVNLVKFENLHKTLSVSRRVEISRAFLRSGQAYPDNYFNCLCLSTVHLDGVLYL